MDYTSSERASQADLDFDSPDPDSAEADKQALLAAVKESNVSTVVQQVAWILNYYPDARDSDITLQLRYWEVFTDSYHFGDSVTPTDLYRLPRLTTLTRARATVQNTYKLFQGSEVVRKRRGQLEEEERERVREEHPTHPVVTVYADESGKTHDYLIVASVWILDNMSTIALFSAINAAKEAHGFDGELHFQKISDRTLPVYLDVLAALQRHASTLSFRALTLPRRGNPNVPDALGRMFYHLLAAGLAREVQAHRVQLPRILQFTKDAEEKGSDQLMLADLRDRLNRLATADLDSKLVIDQVEALPSHSIAFLQLADLFAASLHRRMNVQSSGSHPKDKFAGAFFSTFGLSDHLDRIESLGDAVSVDSM